MGSQLQQLAVAMTNVGKHSGVVKDLAHAGLNDTIQEFARIEKCMADIKEASGKQFTEELTSFVDAFTAWTHIWSIVAVARPAFHKLLMCVQDLPAAATYYIIYIVMICHA